MGIKFAILIHWNQLATNSHLKCMKILSSPCILKTIVISTAICNFITENTFTYANRNAFLTLEIANLASLPTI